MVENLQHTSKLIHDNDKDEVQIFNSICLVCLKGKIAVTEEKLVM